MPYTSAHQLELTLRRPQLVKCLVVVSLVVASATARLSATTIFFSGNLRTAATVTSCGTACTLGVTNSDGDYAQYAAVVASFVVSAPTTMQAITYSYGGGTSLTGATVVPGGLEPYLSLFDSAGNFLASTYGAGCPAGGQTYIGFCYDVSLVGGVLNPGTYQIALTAYENLSLAENYGSGNLSDGFTGLGNLNGSENLNYAFDVILSSNTAPTPEPNFVILAGLAFAAMLLLGKRQLHASSCA